MRARAGEETRGRRETVPLKGAPEGTRATGSRAKKKTRATTTAKARRFPAGAAGVGNETSDVDERKRDDARRVCDRVRIPTVVARARESPVPAPAPGPRPPAPGDGENRGGGRSLAPPPRRGQRYTAVRYDITAS